MNSCFFVGNVTRDAELRELSSTQLLTFSLAVEDKAYKKGEEWVTPVQFLDFEIFGNRAGSLVDKLSKGATVAVTASARFNSWEDKDGNKRSKVSFNVDNIKLLGSKSKGKTKSEPEPVDNDETGDIPF